MSWLQFISSIIASLAWPVCAVLIALIFRRRFSDLLAKLLKLNLPGGFSAEFEKRLTHAEVANTITSEITAVPLPSNAALTGKSGPDTAITGSLNSIEEPDQVKAEGSVGLPGQASSGSEPERKVYNLREFAAGQLDLSVHEFYEASQSHPTGVVMEAWKSLELEILSVIYKVLPGMSVDPRRLTNVGKFMPDLVRNGLLIPDEAIVLQDLRRLRNLAVHTNESVSPSEARRFVSLAESLRLKLRERSSNLQQ